MKPEISGNDVADEIEAERDIVIAKLEASVARMNAAYPEEIDSEEYQRIFCLMVKLRDQRAEAMMAKLRKIG